jgi:uncharacterized membrane-anchored protein
MTGCASRTDRVDAKAGEETIRINRCDRSGLGIVDMRISQRGNHMNELRALLRLACLPWLLVALTCHAAGSTPEERQKAEQVLNSLGWIESGTAPVAGVAQFAVPAGYRFLNPGDTAKLMELMHNPSNGREYFFAPNGMPWFAVLEYEQTGYVKDDEKIDPDPLLESIRKGTEAGNEERKARGWSTLTIVGWKFPPRYDAQSRRLEWAIDARSDGGAVVNYNTRVLGRHGVTSVTLVAEPAQLDQAVQEFKTAIRNFTYTDGERYDEYKQGDKVAEYGLAALVTGGAAAVAIKSGAAKWLWKLLVGVGIAVVAGLRALFGRNKA